MTIDHEETRELIPRALHVLAVGRGWLEPVELPERLLASQIGNGVLSSPVGFTRVERSQLSFGTLGRPYATCVVMAGSAPSASGAR